MRSVNKVVLIGNLTRDPELKNTTSGQAIVTFGLATNRQWTTSSREKRSSAEFHECVAWAKLAEICKQRLKKGMLVYVEGYLKTRSWDLEDGTRRFRTEIVLQDMIILEKRREDGMEDEYIPDEEMGMEPDDMGMPMTSAAPSAASPYPAASASMASAPAAMPSAPTGDSSLSASIEDDNMF